MTLTLRARILLFLAFFGLVPLSLAVAFNLPLVLGRVELLYRHAFLQNLRADFRDLDQHLASRHEMVRLLAKLPEPGMLLEPFEPSGGTDMDIDVDLERVRYTEWINRILADQLDILHISFLDTHGVHRFWLERDPRLGTWNPTVNRPPSPRGDLLKAVLDGNVPSVLLTPVNINPQASHPAWAMTLQMLSPIGLDDTRAPQGLVVMTVDIGGLARRDPNTLWVRDDGSYLQTTGMPERHGSAFDDYPGLRAKFAAGTIGLWEQGGRQAIWVPLLRDSEDRPLWVGRQVDRLPLKEFQQALILRVLSVMLLLIVFTLLFARWFAARAENFGRGLLDGVRRMLQADEPVQFRWRGSRELVQLGESLTELADTHARNTRNLRAHARELEETNRYKSEFLANVSHELLTPLNSILLLSKLLNQSRDEMTRESAEQARVIFEASRDLRALIDDILDLSRIEAGKLDLAIEAVDLRRLLEDLAAFLRPQFEDRGLSLEIIDGAGASTTVKTDANKVRQILKNFLSNAVKFTERGGVRLALQAASPPYEVRLTVTDTGIGIPPEKQTVIFEAFKQADGSTRRRYGGTGLGLTISRQLAELLGGKIELHSSPGAGAEFALLLPRECGVELEDEPSELPVAPVIGEPDAADQAVPEGDFKQRQVLVVDADMRRLLAIAPKLEHWGLTVLAAGDVDEAMETLAEETVALVLVSPKMSALEPYDTIFRMRRSAHASDLPMIALQTADPGDTCRRAITAGADDCLDYPADWSKLHALIERHLSRSEAA